MLTPPVRETLRTWVLSHCLSRFLTASSTLSPPSSTCRLLRAIEAGGLDGDATTPGLSISFTFFAMCTSCIILVNCREEKKNDDAKQARGSEKRIHHKYSLKLQLLKQTKQNNCKQWYRRVLLRDWIFKDCHLLGGASLDANIAC